MDLLQTFGFNVIPTRTADTYLTLQQRSNMLNNAKVDLVVSIHVNSSDKPSPNYIANFIIARGGNAEKAAKVIQEELRLATGWNGPSSPDGIIVSNLHMVRETEAPAVIVEMGFISNPEQEKVLANKDFHNILAKAITKGICKYFNVAYKETLSTYEEVDVIAEDKKYSGMLLDGKTYVHVRVIEEFDLPVFWDDATKTVYIGSRLKTQYPTYEHFANYDVITAQPEQLKVSLIKGKLSKNGINGGYFDSSLNPLGIVIIDGKIIADRVSHRPPRAVFVIDGKGKAKIIPSVAKASLLNVKYALGAGPNLLPEISQTEEFQPDIMNSTRPRSAVGITKDGLVKLVCTNEMTLTQLSKVMRDIGCIEAMNLDGGGSSQMYYKKTIRNGDGRKLSTAIEVSK